MINSIFFRQQKPLTVKILGISFGVLAVLAAMENINELEPVVTMACISLILLSYSISFEIRQDYIHKKHFKLFGLSLFKWKLHCIEPEYVTVFSASSSKGSDWGPVAAMNGKLSEQNYVVRIFRGRQYFTLLRTKSRSLAETKANDLGELLGVETRF